YFRMRDLAIHLRERLLAAHGENRVPEGDQDAERADAFPPLRPSEPAERLVAQMELERRQRRPAPPERRAAPGEHDHDHHRGAAHDLHRLVARLLDGATVLLQEGESDGETLS